MLIFKNEKEIAAGDGVSHMYKLKTSEYAFAVLPHHTEKKISLLSLYVS